MNWVFRSIGRVTFLAVGLVAVTACGGGSSPTSSVGSTATGGTGAGPPPPPSVGYTVSGTVSGLVGQGLTIALLNLANTAHHTTTLEVMPIGTNGAFAFNIPPSQDYNVVVTAQPQTPAQQCVVRKGGGTIGTSDLSDVEIVCGEFSYVANAASNTIAAYSIDATTGALVSGGAGVPAGLSPQAMAIAPDKRYLYVGNSDGNDVSVFAVDGSSGALTTVPGSPFAARANPRALSFYSAAYFGYGAPVLVRYLYVANTGSDNLSAYRLDPIPGTIYRFAAIPTPLRPASYPTGAGPSSLVIDEGYGPFLYAANSGGSNDISGYLIDTSGSLTPIPGSPFPSGSSVSTLAFGAGGKFLYAADASGGAAAIYGFSVDPLGDPNSGALTSLAGSPYPLPSCTFIVADQTGAYLYAATGTNVIGYSIDANTGALSPLPGFPVAVGANADSMTIDPTNQFLYVRNGSAGTVTGFKLNTATGGALTPMPSSPFAVGKSADFIATF